MPNVSYGLDELYSLEPTTSPLNMVAPHRPPLSLQLLHRSLYFSFFHSYASSILDSLGAVSSIVISGLVAVEYNIISGLNRVSISRGKTSRLSRSTRHSQSLALFNKPMLCSLHFVKLFLRPICPSLTNSRTLFFIFRFYVYLH